MLFARWTKLEHRPTRDLDLLGFDPGSDLPGYRDASDLAQLRALSWVGLRQLEVGRPGPLCGKAGRWAVAAGSGAWICFRFERGHAYEVDVVERLGIWPR